MIFNRNKNRMVDIRELQKRGVVRIPKKEIKAPTTSEGFVELSNSTSDSRPSTSDSPQSNADFFGFIDKPTTNKGSVESCRFAAQQPTTSFSDSPDGYNKREVDTKITDLDNKIYKLEQRLELLEKKIDINQASNPALGTMSW